MHACRIATLNRTFQSFLPFDRSNRRVGLTVSLISSTALATAVIIAGLHAPAPTVDRNSERSMIVSSWRDHSRVKSKSAVLACMGFGRAFGAIPSGSWTLTS